MTQELTEEQRVILLAKSAENSWTAARLVKERDRILGKDERVPLLTFDTKVEKLMETLPASATKKTKAALTHVVNDLRHDFETEVEHVVKERLKAQRDKLHELEKEAKEELDRARNLSMNLDGLMTEEEYRAMMMGGGRSADALLLFAARQATLGEGRLRLRGHRLEMGERHDQQRNQRAHCRQARHRNLALLSLPSRPPRQHPLGESGRHRGLWLLRRRTSNASKMLL
jgi:hypothetical protein